MSAARLSTTRDHPPEWTSSVLTADDSIEGASTREGAAHGSPALDNDGHLLMPSKPPDSRPGEHEHLPPLTRGVIVSRRRGKGKERSHAIYEDQVSSHNTALTLCVVWSTGSHSPLRGRPVLPLRVKVGAPAFVAMSILICIHSASRKPTVEFKFHDSLCRATSCIETTFQ